MSCLIECVRSTLYKRMCQILTVRRSVKVVRLILSTNVEPGS